MQIKQKSFLYSCKHDVTKFGINKDIRGLESHRLQHGSRIYYTEPPVQAPGTHNNYYGAWLISAKFSGQTWQLSLVICESSP